MYNFCGDYEMTVKLVVHLDFLFLVAANNFYKIFLR